MMVGWRERRKKEGDESRVGKCLLLVVDPNRGGWKEGT